MLHQTFAAGDQQTTTMLASPRFPILNNNISFSLTFLAPNTRYNLTLLNFHTLMLPQVGEEGKENLNDFEADTL
jgi:hypothetical protein